MTTWTAHDPQQTQQAKEQLRIWPLDEYNAELLNQVHPINYVSKQKPHEVYDLVALGAGAGGLVSAKQSARRGAKRWVHLFECSNSLLRIILTLTFTHTTI